MIIGERFLDANANAMTLEVSHSLFDMILDTGCDLVEYQAQKISSRT